jgi:hypothetical protein
VSHLNAVEPRQPQIEDHEIRQEHMGQVERAHAIPGDPHLVTLEPKRALQHVRDRVVVLDDQHARGTLVVGHAG